MKRVLSSVVVTLSMLCAGGAQAVISFANPSFEDPLSPYNWQVATTDPALVNRVTSLGYYPSRLGGGLISPTSGSYMLCITGQAPSQNKFTPSRSYTPNFVVGGAGSTSDIGTQTLLIDVTYITPNDQFDKSVSEMRLNGVVFASFTGQTQKWRTYAVPIQDGPQELVIMAESMLTNYPAPWSVGQSTICVDNVRTVNGTTF